MFDNKVSNADRVFLETLYIESNNFNVVETFSFREAVNI